MNPEDILKQASDIAQGKRSQHGAENSFAMIARLWTAYLQEAASMSVSITEVDVAQMMVLLKMARGAWGGHNMDTYVDQAGYSAWAGHLEAMAEVERQRDIALDKLEKQRTEERREQIDAIKIQMAAATEMKLKREQEMPSNQSALERWKIAEAVGNAAYSLRPSSTATPAEIMPMSVQYPPAGFTRWD